jgi:hypothetical protein
MGIRFLCPNGHKLNVKSFLAGKRAICPDCGARVLVPTPEETGATRQVGIGSVAIANPPDPSAGFNVTDTASPSIVISVVPTEPNASLPQTSPPLESFSLPPLPESLNAGASPAPVIQVPDDDTQAQLRRERARQKQMIFAIGLLALVIVLAAIMVWVLSRSLNPAPVEEESPPKASPPASTTSSTGQRQLRA